MRIQGLKQKRKKKQTLWVKQRCHLQVNRQKCITLTVCRGFVWRPKPRPRRRARHQPECRPRCSHPADKTVRQQSLIFSYKWQTSYSWAEMSWSKRDEGRVPDRSSGRRRRCTCHRLLFLNRSKHWFCATRLKIKQHHQQSVSYIVVLELGGEPALTRGSPKLPVWLQGFLDFKEWRKTFEKNTKQAFISAFHLSLEGTLHEIVIMTV